jgi:outer membrane protein insertion porin family
MGPRQFRKNTRGIPFTNAPVGGSSQLILNNEVIFPLVQGIGLKGVVFFDAGNAYGGDENNVINDARYAAGGGLRWLSPLGPLRVELGFPFNTKPHDQKQLILFSFGGPFQF